MAGGLMAAGDQVTVPSGQPVRLIEVRLDTDAGATWAHFRFVAPQIAAGGLDYGQTAPDMDHLCASVALPYLRQQNLSPARVVVALSDREMPFGEANPEATQFFEAYRPEGETCIWEEF
jgi:hypothetical protein